ncbi:unnamed protein product [Adineta ricciae]|uniref:Ubiquitin carboxyl-terminal hydrolase n=1 Tax=Adineta ricciae TaxID=249248 RepID=A0A813YVC3_ADIRI|nr:unnamed protein product [Adineta ricciae]
MSFSDTVRDHVCNNPNCQVHNRDPQVMLLTLCYTDKKYDIDLYASVTSPSFLTVADIIRDAREFLFLNDMPLEDIRLVGFRSKNDYTPVDDNDKNSSLKQIGVTSGCVLDFEPTSNAVPPKQCELTIVGPDHMKTVTYKWYRAITKIRDLLEYIIEQFSLQSIDRNRIHLFTIFDELNLIARMNLRMSESGLHTRMNVHVEIIPPLSPSELRDDADVRVECSNEEEEFVLKVSKRKTLDNLKQTVQQRCKNRTPLNFTIRNEVNEEISLVDGDRTLQSIGIKSGHTIYATFRLKNQQSSATTTKEEQLSSPSSDTNVKNDKITIICQLPTENPVTTQLSIKDTLDRLLKYIDSLIGHRRLVISKISSDKISINRDEDRSRCFANMGFQPGDVIYVSTKDRTPVRSTIVSDRSPSPPETEEKPKSSKKLPIGLDNLGNSCYMNSAFQCLAHIPPLTNFFLDHIDSVHLANKNTDDLNPFDEVGYVIGAYADLLWNLCRCDEADHGGCSFKPTRIKGCMADTHPRYGRQDQQDAQEFMNYFLEIIHKEIKKSNPNERITIIKQLFFGEITSIVTCMKCQSAESNTQPISFLSIPLNRQERTFWIKFIPMHGEDMDTYIDVPINAEVGHIVEFFAKTFNDPSLFFHILAMLPEGEVNFRTPLREILTDELVFMEQEQRTKNILPPPLNIPKRASTLDNCLEDFFSPEVLEEERSCSYAKCRQKAQVIKQLKFQTLPLVLVIQFKRFLHENGLHQKIHTHVNYPITGLDLNRFLSTPSKDAIYDLVAVCNHSGGVAGGHYTACAQHSFGNKTNWYKFDDAYVNRIKPDDYGFDIVTRKAYLLFYVKRSCLQGQSAT